MLETAPPRNFLISYSIPLVHDTTTYARIPSLAQHMFHITIFPMTCQMRNCLQVSPSPRCQPCISHAQSKSTYGLLAFPLVRPQRSIHVKSAQRDSYQPTSLDNSRQLAQLRAQESSEPSPLLTDPFAPHLAETSNSPEGLPSDMNEPVSAAFDLVAARFIDDQLLLASSQVNSGRNQEYNQVVLIGDGYCTRPFRLPWPSGTVIYMVAPGEVHERAEALLSGVSLARVPRGCLLRRVDCNFADNSSFAAALHRAGYRSDRLSVWGLQARKH